MEPCYVAFNRHMDAMAIAWLFANDFIFFNPDEIAWNGSRHAMTGIQLNAEKIGEIPKSPRENRASTNLLTCSPTQTEANPATPNPKPPASPPRTTSPAILALQNASNCFLQGD